LRFNADDSRLAGWVPLSGVKPQSEVIDLPAVEAVELWETRRGFSKACGKGAFQGPAFHRASDP